MENKTNNRVKILNAAWKLFEEKGYDNTTVDEIIEATDTSKGTFYHYFKSKEDLLSLFSYMFDERYEELSKKLDIDMNSFDKLIVLCEDCFTSIENDCSLELVSRMYSAQLFFYDRTSYRIVHPPHGAHRSSYTSRRLRPLFRN